MLAWQQTPLFLSETPPVVDPAQSAPWTLTNRRGGRLITHPIDHRWITIAEKPFSLAGQIAASSLNRLHWFRADFTWSPLATTDIPAIWSTLQSGQSPTAAHTANFLRGLA